MELPVYLPYPGILDEYQTLFSVGSYCHFASIRFTCWPETGWKSVEDHVMDHAI